MTNRTERHPAHRRLTIRTMHEYVNGFGAVEYGDRFAEHHRQVVEQLIDSYARAAEEKRDREVREIQFLLNGY